MSATQGFDRLLVDWLEQDGPQQVPDHVVESGLAAARMVGQVGGRVPGMTFAVRIGSLLPRPAPRSRAALAFVVVALVLATVAGALLVGHSNRGLLGTPGLIVFSVDGRLRFANADGSDPRPVLGAAAFSREPRWSPDGRRLAFLTGASPDEPLDLVVLDDPTAQPRLVARQLRDPFEPSWSPDSSRLIVDAGDPALPNAGFLYEPRAMFVINAATGANARLTIDGLNPRTPRWSPTDDRILFWGQGFDPETGLYIIHADGTGLQRVVPVQCRPYTYCFGWLDWSPDGSRIAFADGDPTYDIWTVAPDGSSLRDLSIGHANALNPTWSPDGTKLAWLEDATALEVDSKPNGQIVVANADGSGRTVITQADRIGWTAPRWSPDGKSIIAPVYNPAIDGLDRLGVFPVSGGQPTYLSLGGSLASDPGWQRKP